MDKEQLKQSIEEIGYTCDCLSHTIEYIERCLVELLKQKELLSHDLIMLNKKRNPLGYKQSNDKETTTSKHTPSDKSES